LGNDLPNVSLASPREPVQHSLNRSRGCRRLHGHSFFGAGAGENSPRPAPKIQEASSALGSKSASQ
jgi:hypothetical protein